MTTPSGIPSVLRKIVFQKQVEIRQINPANLTGIQAAPFGLREKLEQNRAAGNLSVIAECKKGSPSEGIIDPDYDPVSIAREYEAAGASAISVLTDNPFFHGNLTDLEQVTQAVSLPVLRKDFILEEIQIEEARWYGAHVFLLIASLMGTEKLRTLREAGEGLGMDALVEIHTEAELEKALQSGARIIGINNRNLHDFSVDLNTTVRLAGIIRERQKAGDLPADLFIIGESAIHTPEDVSRLRPFVDGILVGTSLMRGGEARADLLRRFLDAFGR